MTEYLPIVVQTVTILSSLAGAVTWLAKKLQDVNQIPDLVEGIKRLESNDVTHDRKLEEFKQSTESRFTVLGEKVLQLETNVKQALGITQATQLLEPIRKELESLGYRLTKLDGGKT